MADREFNNSIRVDKNMVPILVPGDDENPAEWVPVPEYKDGEPTGKQKKSARGVPMWKKNVQLRLTSGEAWSVNYVMVSDDKPVDVLDEEMVF